MGTLDLVPGFRYVISNVAREGVKTVNKQENDNEDGGLNKSARKLEGGEM
jgi:hypothetical protein